MISGLRNKWFDLCSNYSEDLQLIATLWNEILKNYSSPKRHYHNLFHLKSMFEHYDKFKDQIIDKNNFQFAIWYHDIIYNASKKNNEEESARLAKKRLLLLDLSEKEIQTISLLIKSTKLHENLISENLDNAYFLDIDLSILGTEWNIYENYTNAIRKEYSIYPYFMYKSGRKKALQHFLTRKFIYFTDVFRNSYEVIARDNILKEIELL